MTTPLLAQEIEHVEPTADNEARALELLELRGEAILKWIYAQSWDNRQLTIAALAYCIEYLSAQYIAVGLDVGLLEPAQGAWCPPTPSPTR